LETHTAPKQQAKLANAHRVQVVESRTGLKMLSLPNDEGFAVRNANHAAIETCSSETESGLRGSASVPAGISIPVARDLRARGCSFADNS
jgi:hypothetical protein